jgi:hypothetical protein
VMRPLLCTALLAIGCHHDYCKDAVHYCDGNVIHFCVDSHSDGHYWDSQPCAQGYCVEIDDGDGAICASDPEPRPACAGVDNGSSRICDGAQQITCSYGYAQIKLECAGPEYCEPSLYICTVRPGPQDKCAARTAMVEPYPYPASYCDGNSYVRCDGSFAVGETDCGAQSCYETTQAAGCKQSADPDPVCIHPEYLRPYRVCSNNVNIECLGAYRIGSFGCTTGTCVANGCQG